MPLIDPELLTALKEPLVVISTGLVALLAAVLQVRLSNLQAGRRLQLEKIERAYQLCNRVYEGHRRQIQNMKANWPASRSKFMENEKHPGDEMSELKMLVGCYMSELDADLCAMDKGHQPLKHLFRRLVDEAKTPGSVSASDLATEIANVDTYFLDLEAGANKLKAGLKKVSARHLK